MPDQPILVADSDADFREALASAFEITGFEVEVAEDGDEALATARRMPPAAAVIEVPLGGISGYEVCRALKSEFGDDVPVVFTSACRTESFDRVAGLLVGADDYVPKPCSTGEVLARVRNLLRRTSDGAKPRSPGTPKLTRREGEVLALLAEGLQQRDIAGRLFISPSTVATHIENVMRKLAVRTRAQAVAVAYREALLERPAAG